MRMKRSAILGFLVLLAIAGMLGCGSKASVTERQSFVAGENITRPDRVIVYDFAATRKEVRGDASRPEYWEEYAREQSPEQIEFVRKLGDVVASELVKKISKLGMPAERAATAGATRVNDLVIMGEFVTIDEGSKTKRMLIGFGAGAAELKTHVAVYQVTEDGLRPLGIGQVATAGGKLPGMLVPVAGGAAAGRAATSAVVSGGLNVAQERGPESIAAAGERTAGEIAKTLGEAFRKGGWIK